MRVLEKDSLAGRDEAAVTRLRACGRTSPQPTRRAWTKIPNISPALTASGTCLPLLRPGELPAQQAPRPRGQVPECGRSKVLTGHRAEPLADRRRVSLGLALWKSLPHPGSLVPQCGQVFMSVGAGMCHPVPRHSAPHPLWGPQCPGPPGSKALMRSRKGTPHWVDNETERSWSR